MIIIYSVIFQEKFIALDIIDVATVLFGSLGLSIDWPQTENYDNEYALTCEYSNIV